MSKKNVTIRMSEEEKKWHTRNKPLTDQVKYDRKLLQGLLALAKEADTSEWSLKKAINHVKKMIGD